MPNNSNNEYEQIVESFFLSSEGLSTLGVTSLKDYIEKLREEDTRFTSGDLKIEDYYFKVGRLVSSGVIGKYGYNCTEFPEDILKKRVDLFNTLPIRTDHNMWSGVSLSNGVTFASFWVESAQTKDALVPSGVNGIIGINSKMEGSPNLIEGLKQHSAKNISVTTLHSAKRSHTFEYNYVFHEKRGSKLLDDEGNESFVRLIVTDIAAAVEGSFVLLGADFNATLLDEKGNRVGSVNPKVLEAYSNKNVGFKFDNGRHTVVSLHRSPQSPQQKKDMELKAILQSYGFTADKADTTDGLTEVITSLHTKLKGLQDAAIEAAKKDFDDTLNLLEESYNFKYSDAELALFKNAITDALPIIKSKLESFDDVEAEKTKQALENTICKNCGGSFSLQSSVDAGDGNPDANINTEEIIASWDERFG